MLKKKNIYILLILFISHFTFCIAQNNSGTSRINQYICEYKDLSIKNMFFFGIPASITLAQGILESKSGMSLLTQKANNHFGIKCKSDWTGETYAYSDDKPDECFRKYDSPEESFRDHSVFISTRPRYAFLFQFNITDYKSWAIGLKQAGYATNVNYSRMLIELIERYNLYEYDKIGLALIEENNIRKLNQSCQDILIAEASKKSNVLSEMNQSTNVNDD